MRLIALLLGVLLAAPCASGQEPAFVTGRPGNTESPISVPKGYFQVETELAAYAHDRADGVRASETRALATDFRYGIADGADVEMIVSPYIRNRVRDAGGVDTQSGIGDVTLRARRTFTGEDGDGPAFALIGLVTLPTARDGLGADKVEGGLIATGVSQLSDKSSLTLTLGAATIHDGVYQGDVYAGANVSFALTDKAGLYVELFGDKAARSELAATFDLGGTYLVGAATQLDAGVNLGLNDSADDFEVFAGWSHRF
jgi:hypothetical protein